MIDFLITQRSLLTARRGFHEFEAVRLVGDYAQKVHSDTLMRLAPQVPLAMQPSDAFEKAGDRSPK